MTTSLLRFLPLAALAASLLSSRAAIPLWLSAPSTNTCTTNTVLCLRALADSADGYFWLSNGVPIAGATTNALYLTVSRNITNTLYSVVASNASGLSTNRYYAVRLPSGTQTYRPAGDVNLGGVTVVLDLLEVGGFIHGSKVLTGASLDMADVDRNYVIDWNDQALIHGIILGRTNLPAVNTLESNDSAQDGLPNRMKWRLGLSTSTDDTDGDGVPDATELQDGTDPTDPRSLVFYGTYIATPPVSIFVATPDPDDAGLFVATPPVSIFVATPDPDDAGLFVATPPVTIFIATPDPNDAGLFVATPPVTIKIGL